MIKTLPCGCTLIKDENAKTAEGVEAWFGGSVCKMHADQAAQNAIVSANERALQEKTQAIRELELSNLRKLYDGEDLTAVNAARLALRTEVQTLAAEKVVIGDVKSVETKE